MRPASPASPASEDRLSAAQAMALYGVTLLGLVVASPFLAPFGLPGLMIAQVAIIGAPSFALVRVRGLSLRRALGLTAPPAPALLGAVLLGLSLWLVLAVTVVPLVELFTPVDELKELEEQLTGGPYPLWLRLVAFAALPGVCEEILFRGAIARGFNRRYGPAVAIVLSSVLFGLFHLSAARLFPTAILGGFLAYACLRSGSTIPGMVAHALNNAVALTLATADVDEEVIAPFVFPAVAGAFLLTALGTWLIARSQADSS